MRTQPIGAAFVALPASAALADTPRQVITGYADLALVKYSDSLTTAQDLNAAIAAFVASPSAQTHEAAKAAWLAARVPYQQTEAYRFGNAVVDEALRDKRH